MTECRSEKIRNLIITHLGKEELENYDETIKQCKLGKALKDDRVWAPLCPKYPNLKGITCEEIDEFVGERPHKFFSTQEYHDLCRRTRDPLRQLEFDENLEERRERFFHSVKKHMTYDEFESFKKSIITLGSVDRVMERIENLKFTDNTQFVEDYLRHVRVYDRDEAYEAFKNIGDMIEATTPGILKDPSTIFVTTPRGGHEMLSIFSYANDIDKGQIPSDIKFQHMMPSGTTIHEEKYREDPIGATKYLEKIGYEEGEEITTDIYGSTWLRNPSLNIKTVFIVDDIIASGEQIHKTAMKLEEMFPDATINSVTLCKRDETRPALPQEINKYYTDTETIGINRFKDFQERGKLENEYVTCLFPHACPDGDSDKLMIELMGDDRCSPEKRIARKDL